MKKVFIAILTIIIIFCRTSKAQVTYHFQHTEGVWGQFSGGYAYPCPGCPEMLIGQTYYLFSLGDTLINGVSYIKIYSGDSTGSALSFSSAIREDSLGKIWKYTGLPASDSLLYNFNVNEGDTVHVYDPYTYTQAMLVDSISTVTVNGTLRKAIFFNPYVIGGGCCITGGIISNQLIWVEGIGSTSGLFEPYGSSAVIDKIVFLTCYKQNDSLFFGDVCNVVYTNTEDIKEAFNCDIAPNPNSGNFTIFIQSTNP